MGRGKRVYSKELPVSLSLEDVTACLIGSKSPFTKEEFVNDEHAGITLVRAGS